MNYKLYFTKNNQKLREYFAIRKAIYAVEIKMDIEIEIHDINSEHLIIETIDGEVVGGARLSNNKNGNPLPMQDFGAIIDKEVDTTDMCEICRVSIVKEHRSMEIFTEVFKKIKTRAVELNYKTLVVLGSHKTIRLDAIMCVKINVETTTIEGVSFNNTFYPDRLGNCSLLLIKVPYYKPEDVNVYSKRKK